MKQNSIVLAYIADTSGGKTDFHNIPVYLRPGKSLRDWASERGKTPQHRIMLFISSVAANNVQICTLATLNSQCIDAWHNTRGTVSQDKIQPCCYSERIRHSFEDSNVHVLDREERWLERQEKEAVFVNLENPPQSRGGS